MSLPASNPIARFESQARRRCSHFCPPPAKVAARPTPDVRERMSRSAKSNPYRTLAITPIQLENATPILYELMGDSTEIGSADDNAIVLSDSTVAAHHLAI